MKKSKKFNYTKKQVKTQDTTKNCVRDSNGILFMRNFFLMPYS